MLMIIFIAVSAYFGVLAESEYVCWVSVITDL